MVTDPSKVSAVPVEHKDVREFEHGRQKAKKTARTQNWREDKAHRRRVKTGEAVSVSAPPQPAKRGARGTYRESGVRPDWEEGWSAEDAHDEFLHDAMEEWEHGEGAGRIVRSESGKLEVDLTNLMKPAKARRGKRGMFLHHPHPEIVVRSRRRRCTAMGDFEVLPSVRQVVALEDRLEDELELDEPWEHLSANGDDEKPFSYAEIAATAC